MKPRILVVDDEQPLRRALARALTAHDYDVRESADCSSALRLVDAFQPDVILLDLMLPDGNGVDVCRAVRQNHRTPIIVLSVIGEEETKVSALDEGADDYLTKPFGMNELLARVRVALRRGATDRAQQPRIEIGDLAIDLERRAVSRAGEGLHLTPTEYSLLRFLALNSGKLLTHAMILREVWGSEYAGDTHVLRTCMSQLRAKLREDPAQPKLIKTDPGIGYRLEPPES
jgi:two-component system KDP operon response regulator KdpE